MKTVYTINEALTSPPAKTTNNTTEESSSVIFDDGDGKRAKTETMTATITPIISQSPSEEIEDPILHVIGDDFNEFII